MSDIHALAKAVVNHWNEFGPERGFEETIHHLEKHIANTDPGGWLPIDDAPKDGSKIITGAFNIPNSAGQSFWDEAVQGFRDCESRELIFATHFQPLPELPASNGVRMNPGPRPITEA